MSALPLSDNRSILTKTGGFLKSGYTHTLNPYSGCAFANSICGTFCYAQHNHWITQGRPWGLYAGKKNVREAYRRDHDRLRNPRKGEPKPLRIYMASSTDPYLPQEKTLELTRGALEEMLERPPDVLVLQTRGTLVRRDLELIAELSTKATLWLSVTVETDLDPVPGFPPHATRPADRLEVLAEFRQAGVRTQATVSPLLPIGDLDAFAASLESACDRVIVDHYLLGDGSHGLRTKRTGFVERLIENGFERWTTLDAMDEVVAGLRAVLGEERVLLSCAGFNAT